ncbi:MAG: EAL domain-containing protein [Thiobacillus sp.]|nr:EAL domain-containing protein [Thiobacillus sp.]
MKWPASIPIKQATLVFVTGVLVLVSLIGGFALFETRSVSRNLTLASQAAARAELAAAVERLSNQIKSQADTLALWDETRQQLVAPEYYTYWRDQRVYESGALNSRLARVALYDQSGKVLALNTTKHNLPDKLPTNISPHHPTSWLSNEAGVIVLYYAFPIYSDGRRLALLGHGLIRLDYMAELLNPQSLRFTDTGSVKLALNPGVSLPASKLFASLHFSARPDPNQSRFQTILSRALLALFVVLAATALLGFAAHNRLLIRPLRQLSRDIDAMKQGRFNFQPAYVNPLRISELENIRRSLFDYQLQLRELHGSLEHQNREFRSQARQDVLTGCYNRRAYEEDWKRFREEIKAVPQGVAYLLFDCDRFKSINDTYGHAIGDRVLTLIADALVMALRANDRLYRLGGDEFAAIMLRTTPAQARQIAQRCQNLLDAKKFSDLGINEPISISIGIAFFAADQLDRVDELPKQADIAMYTAKQPGRNRVALFGDDPERAAQTLVASRETSAVFQALATPGMIEMHYQPIHSLPGLEVKYCEALARIRHHDKLIMPDAFLPVVSSRRLETGFDLAVLHQVDLDLSSRQLPAGVGISINLTAQSVSQPEIVSYLLELSRHNTRHPLMIEIAETSLITQVAEARTYLDLLRTAQYRIAMDDFGTGHSPLRYLADLPVDVIKFDISLIRKLEENDRAAQVVTDFARMMISAGYSLTAEGVETDAALRKVESMGFSHIQGFLLDHPLPLAQVVASLVSGESGKTDGLRDA